MSDENGACKDPKDSGKASEEKKQVRVRITLELSESFLKLLGAKASFCQWKEKAAGDVHPGELDAGDVLAWLVYLEGRGAPENQIHVLTPMMWRIDGPVLIHEERKVLK